MLGSLYNWASETKAARRSVSSSPASATVTASTRTSSSWSPMTLLCHGLGDDSPHPRGLQPELDSDVVHAIEGGRSPGARRCAELSDPRIRVRPRTGNDLNRDDVGKTEHRRERRLVDARRPGGVRIDDSRVRTPRIGHRAQITHCGAPHLLAVLCLPPARREVV